MKQLIVIIPRLVVLLTAILGAIFSSHAANISLTSITTGQSKYGENCTIAEISLTGEIVYGDAESLQRVIQSIASKSKDTSSSCDVNGSSSPALVSISLNSNGGDYAEGWAIAKTLEGEKISTIVRDNHQCLSACAIMFLAGSVIAAEETSLINRVLMPKAQLGFHAPFPSLPDRLFTRDEVISAFESAFTVYSEFMQRSSLLGVPSAVVPQLLQPTPNNVFSIDDVKHAMILKIGIQFSSTMEFEVIDNVSSLPSYPLSYFVNSCLNYYQMKTHEDISIKILTNLLSKETPSLIHLVRAKDLHVFGDDDFNESLVFVPVDPGNIEGGSRDMCVVAVTKNKDTNKLQSFCLGFDNYQSYSEIDEFVKKRGAQGVLDKFSAAIARDCLELPDYAGLPGDTKLADIQSALGRLAKEPAVFPGN
jgi:hypothetical protein